MKKTRSKSSHRWLQEHEQDHFVRRARAEGYRSRAAFKLLEIQEKDQLIKKGMTIVDLGASPGSWSEVAVKLLNGTGRLIALDILPFRAMEDVEFIQGDFTEDETLSALQKIVGDGQVDLVISDMAPNMSGIVASDIPKSIYLAELALEFAIDVLPKGGALLMKAFHGEGFDDLVSRLHSHFTQVKIRKPKSSRSKSKEVYLVAMGYR